MEVSLAPGEQELEGETEGRRPRGDAAASAAPERGGHEQEGCLGHLCRDSFPPSSPVWFIGGSTA